MLPYDTCHLPCLPNCGKNRNTQTGTEAKLYATVQSFKASCTTRIKLSPLHERGKGPKFTKPQLQSELNEYGVPSDGNSQQLRAELVRVARGGIGKSPSSAFASTDYGSVSRATGNETLPNNKNVQSKTGTEMEVIR
ncbi:hypothetical protein J6590_100754 [Homalodisca vitripennis]|nr:hypothetical protein J6590_100754 [Homalodisca vitripennis]